MPSQVGLLDPKAVPPAKRDKEVQRLPVVGKEEARLVFGYVSGREDVEANGLIQGCGGRQ